MPDLRPRYSFTRFLLGRVGYDRYCARCDGLIDVLVAVAGLAAHGNENVAGIDSPRIVFDTADSRISSLREDLRAIQQLLEDHWG